MIVYRSFAGLPVTGSPPCRCCAPLCREPSDGSRRNARRTKQCNLWRRARDERPQEYQPAAKSEGRASAGTGQVASAGGHRGHLGEPRHRGRGRAVPRPGGERTHPRLSRELRYLGHRDRDDARPHGRARRGDRGSSRPASTARPTRRSKSPTRTPVGSSWPAASPVPTGRRATRAASERSPSIPGSRCCE